MNREAAIEAAARALDPQAWDDALWDALDPTGQAQAERQQLTRQEAATAVDAALPHLVGQPVGWALMLGRAPIGCYPSLEAALHARRSEKWAFPIRRVVALVPVDEP